MIHEPYCVYFEFSACSCAYTSADARQRRLGDVRIATHGRAHHQIVDRGIRRFHSLTLKP